MDSAHSSMTTGRKRAVRWSSLLLSVGLVATGVFVVPVVNAAPAYADGFLPMEELQASFEVSGDRTFVLREDIVARKGERLVVPADSAVKTLDLNGFSLTITLPANYAAAVNVRSNANFVVTDTSESGDGHLVATGGMWGSGIGADGLDRRPSGNVTIRGGVVAATGGTQGAGIGGGYNGTSGEVTVTGGDVTATGGLDAAGIGGGKYAPGSTVKVTGGSVTAHGGDMAAGIGGGHRGAGGNVTVSAGAVTATGGWNGAGIGGGYGGAGGNVTVSAGAVTATGGWNGAGIGGGDSSDGGLLSVAGGAVTATGGVNGAGIGGGHSGGGSAVTISGGHLTAVGGPPDGELFPAGAAIGSGASPASTSSSGGTILFQGFAPTPTPELPTSYSRHEARQAKVSTLTSDESTARFWNFTVVENSTSDRRSTAKVVVEWSDAIDSPSEELDEAPGAVTPPVTAPITTTPEPTPVDVEANPGEANPGESTTDESPPTTAGNPATAKSVATLATTGSEVPWGIAGFSVAMILAAGVLFAVSRSRAVNR